MPLRVPTMTPQPVPQKRQTAFCQATSLAGIVPASRGLMAVMPPATAPAAAPVLRKSRRERPSDMVPSCQESGIARKG